MAWLLAQALPDAISRVLSRFAMNPQAATNHQVERGNGCRGRPAVGWKGLPLARLARCRV